MYSFTRCISAIRALALASLLAMASLLSGCASLFSANSYDVLVNSEPGDVNFTVTDKRGAEVARGVTPETVHLNAYGGGYSSPARYRVRFERTGLQSLDLPLNAKLSPVYLLNFIGVAGVVGFLIIDPLTGALYELPERIDGQLTSEPVGQELSPPDATSQTSLSGSVTIR